MGPGTLYGTLEKLHAEGWIEACGDQLVDGRTRRLYRLTENGLAAVVHETEHRLESAGRVQRILGATR
jgi:DNA-binding PadR family transcriptional regulator